MRKIILEPIISRNGDTLLRPVAKRSSWKWWALAIIAVLIFGYGIKRIFAQTNPSAASYVPLIGITAIPNPLVLPNGPGEVTYHYAVKSFVEGMSLTNVQVVDNHCSPVTFVTGDENGNAELDYGETWIYTCTTKISTTTESIAMATGVANGLTATDVAHTTVVVGSKNPPPLVSIVNVTKVAYPLSLPSGGGPVTFTYKVTNPGVVPLSNVTVSDDQCNNMSAELGDTNGNGLLDPSEVWTYTCTTILRQTTTNTATVTAYANGLQAVDDDAITVDVATSSALAALSPVPGFPDNGINPNVPGFPDNGINPGLPNNGINPVNITVVVWIVLGAIILILLIVFLLIRKKK